MDKDLLLKARLPEADVEIEGVGTVRVRGLSRGEVVEVTALDGLAYERKMLSLCLIDPVLTEDEAAEWQTTAPVSEFMAVISEINRLSGFDKQATKDEFKERLSDPDAAFRDVPGAPDAPDGG